MSKQGKDTANGTEPKAWASGIPVYCAHDAIAKISELRPNPMNPNKHPPEQIKKLGGVIRRNGWRQPITVSTRSGMIVKGHGRLMAAELEELDEAPVDYQDYESEAAEMADLWADNYIAELAETDQQLAASLLAGIQQAGEPLELAGSSQAEYDAIVRALTAGEDAEEDDEDEDPEEDEPIEPPEAPVTQRGDIWILGRHRVMCGDATSKRDVEDLLAGEQPEILITDPPYCSGGFQEGGRSTGSIGTVRKDKSGKQIETKIANDTLSTRGYQSLMKAALENSPATVAYIFTDWRMWVYLYDIVESSGLGVKSMIVWNKSTPGMGVGWRSQHELAMFGLKRKPNWNNHKGYGNVLTIARSGNEYHPTQKPLDLIAALLDNTEWAEGVLDFFGGSGTTLIAAEDAGQSSYIMELTPGYTDVIVERYIRHTGKADVKCIRNGRELTRAEIMPLLSRAIEGGETG